MRPELVEWLTTNCDCWKNKSAVLNDEKAFTEQDLEKLKQNAEASTLAVNALKTVGTTLGLSADTTLSSLPEAVANAMDKKMSDAMKMKKDEEDADPKPKKKEEPAMNQEQVTNTVKSYLAGLSEKERLDLIASPTINSLIKTANGVVEERKVEVIKSLTANISNVEEKKAKILKLNKKSLEELKEIAEFVGNAAPTPDHKTEEDRILANYFGAQGGPSGTNNKAASYSRTDVLLPSMALNSEEVETEVE